MACKGSSGPQNGSLCEFAVVIMHSAYNVTLKPLWAIDFMVEAVTCADKKTHGKCVIECYMKLFLPEILHF